MSRGPSTFRQRDLAAALKACCAAGQQVATIVVGKDGQIVLTLVAGKDRSLAEDTNEWDAEFDDNPS